jgi:hypothetical protein
MSFSENDNPTLEKLADLAQNFLIGREYIRTGFGSSELLAALHINKKIGLNASIFGTDKVSLTKIGNCKYKAEIPRCFDILMSITPSFPLEWVKSLDLQIILDTHYGLVTVPFSTQNPGYNLFFNRPLVHPLHIGFSMVITIDERVDEDFSKTYNGNTTLSILEISGLMLDLCHRTRLLNTASDYVLSMKN